MKSGITFNAITAVAAITAASAAATSLTLGLPIWAMFIGWVAFFSRGHSIRDGLINYGGVLAGVILGMAAATAIAALSPALGKLALPAVVFIVAMVVVSLRAVPVMNNVLAYFLGLIAFFAAHMEPSLETGVRLGGGVCSRQRGGLVIAEHPATCRGHLTSQRASKQNPHRYWHVSRCI